MERIKTHRDLKVYQLSFEAGMEVFEMSKLFPKERKSIHLLTKFAARLVLYREI